jgi:hypothetical protein
MIMFGTLAVGKTINNAEAGYGLHSYVAVAFINTHRLRVTEKMATRALRSLTPPSPFHLRNTMLLPPVLLAGRGTPV